MHYVRLPLREQVRQARGALLLTALLVVLTAAYLVGHSLPARSVAQLNAGRLDAGLPPLSVPSAYWTWTPSHQLVWAINAERTVRGLPPANAATFDRPAVVQGVATNADPNPNFYVTGVVQAESIWAWVSVNPSSPSDTGAAVLQILDAWVYQDGWQGSATSNIDCTSPHALGCWGHRDAVLGDVPGATLYVVPVVSLHYYNGEAGTSAAALLVWSRVPLAR